MILGRSPLRTFLVLFVLGSLLIWGSAKAQNTAPIPFSQPGNSPRLGCGVLNPEMEATCNVGQPSCWRPEDEKYSVSLDVEPYTKLNHGISQKRCGAGVVAGVRFSATCETPIVTPNRSVIDLLISGNADSTCLKDCGGSAGVMKPRWTIPFSTPATGYTLSLQIEGPNEQRDGRCVVQLADNLPPERIVLSKSLYSTMFKDPILKGTLRITCTEGNRPFVGTSMYGGCGAPGAVGGYLSVRVELAREWIPKMKVPDDK